MTSNNETVPAEISVQEILQTLLDSMTSAGNSAPLPANIDRRPPLQRGLMNFLLQNLQLYNKSFQDKSLGKQLALFPSDLQGNINY